MLHEGYKVQLFFEDEYEDVQAKDFSDLIAKIGLRFSEIRT
jgi:hypothetical protein